MAFAAEEAGNGEASPLGDMTGKIVILHTNDTHGHDVGDQVLRLVASRLSKVTGGGRAWHVAC